jgi:lysophospholipase L1-like esterase
LEGLKCEVLMQKEFIEKAIANRGNLQKLKDCMKKAQRGEHLAIAFLGGSITQGALATEPENCYAYRVYEWFTNQFPTGSFQYINAGIGGTTSQFGVARVEQDVLAYKPDFLIVEFSVNDVANEFFEETYEGLIRKISYSRQSPAVLIVNNVFYDTGENAQDYHNKIGKAYHIPCVSIKDSLYQKMKEGLWKEEELTPDHLHPNDKGHKLIADVINGFLDMVYDEIEQKEEKISLPTTPLTANQYEQSILCQNDTIVPMLEGFVKDDASKGNIRDIFKKGWIASAVGDKITFAIQGTGIAIQYRKSVVQPTPIAKVVIDGEVEKAILLDGNFEETWGDSLHLETVYFHGEENTHDVMIEIVEALPEDKVPFYLVSVIASK